MSWSLIVLITITNSVTESRLRRKFFNFNKMWQIPPFSPHPIKGLRQVVMDNWTKSASPSGPGWSPPPPTSCSVPPEPHPHSSRRAPTKSSAKWSKSFFSLLPNLIVSTRLEQLLVAPQPFLPPSKPSAITWIAVIVFRWKSNIELFHFGQKLTFKQLLNMPKLSITETRMQKSWRWWVASNPHSC